ncbi:helix-turn-helix domain-containing protein [Clostridium perfringens]|uniref:Helix-turn-helix domain-containing protein n=1 Tax=Clostridium perfringens TaxID=1502 RepID=A0AAW9IXQ1_CLOPF|nr:helix-turn-helix transcriptional regulator [Clostridium perfringens]EDS80596.1 helix-turn-helix domain protein [Clostridium perfringens C str. JGS1495]ELC8373635.1 helix-turn-helix domain-containing protein [Clostridium perfringens]MBI6079092.1 helix-turn-helix domain-containing protein [Clostridium perfringens]MBI6084940.1 helix-turn-helix domain-containing protein [Clostridium perfringens]MBI6098680.1 helix-turn-helix domain-containing protein [Clostridium perfringens]
MGINDFIKIGNSLKEIRKNHSLTQEEMAKALNIPRSTYANYENNKREPSKELLEKISEVFNIPLIDKPVSIFSGPGGEQLKKSLSMPINNDIKKYFDSPITKNALIELINNEYNEKIAEPESNESILNYHLLSALLESLDYNIDLLEDTEQKELLDKIKEFTQFEIYKLEKLKGISLLKEGD